MKRYCSWQLLLVCVVVATPLFAVLPDHRDGIPDDTVAFNAGAGPFKGLWAMSYTQRSPLPFYSGDPISGGFTLFNDAALTPDPNHSLVGDIDGDGVADLVLIGSSGSQQVYTGVITPVTNGVGTLPNPAAPTVSTPMNPAAYAFFLADVAGDGREDPVVVSDGSGAMLWESAHSQPGGLGFNPSDVSSAVFGQTGNLPLVGDLNGDGRADVGQRIKNPGQPNDGDFEFALSDSGGLHSPTSFDIVQGGFGQVTDVVAVLMGDLNGDGRDEPVVVDNRFGNGAYVWQVGLTAPSGDPSGLAVAAGGTSFASPFGVAPPGTTIQVPLLADLNGDGRDDLVQYWEYPSADPQTPPMIGQWLVAFTPPGGDLTNAQFDASGTVFLSAEYAGNRPMVGQFTRRNADGVADRIAVRPNETGAYIWFADRGTATGWGDALADSAGIYGDSTWKPMVGDVNGDGIADRVISKYDAVGGGLLWEADFSLSNGAGFGDGVTDYAGYFGLSGWVPLCLADVDGDGKDDRVLYDVGHPIGVSWFFDHNEYPLQFGDGVGDGTGASLYGIKAYHAPIGVGDVDGDGYADRVLNLDKNGGLAWDVDLSEPTGGPGGTPSFGTDGVGEDATYYGVLGMTPLLGDVDGDGKADRILVHASGVWEADISDGWSLGGLWGDSSSLDHPMYSPAAPSAAYGMPGDIFLAGDVLGPIAPVTPACNTPKADLNGDGYVDGSDYGVFAGCFNGTGNPVVAGCECADLNDDLSVDGSDYGLFAGCFNGTGNPPNC